MTKVKEGIKVYHKKVKELIALFPHTTPLALVLAPFSLPLVLFLFQINLALLSMLWFSIYLVALDALYIGLIFGLSFFLPQYFYYYLGLKICAVFFVFFHALYYISLPFFFLSDFMGPLYSYPFQSIFEKVYSNLVFLPPLGG